MSDDADTGRPKQSRSDQEHENKRQRTHDGESKSDDAVTLEDNIGVTQASNNDVRRFTTDLNRDYAKIAELMRQLDTQVGTFSTSMNGMVDSIPSHDGLAALWEGLSRPAAATRSTGTVHQPTNDVDRDEAAQQQYAENLILGDEAEDPDDKLIFL